MARATSINSLSFALSSCDIYLIRSVTKSDHKFIATLTGPNIYTLTFLLTLSEK